MSMSMNNENLTDNLTKSRISFKYFTLLHGSTNHCTSHWKIRIIADIGCLFFSLLVLEIFPLSPQWIAGISSTKSNVFMAWNWDDTVLYSIFLSRNSLTSETLSKEPNFHYLFSRTNKALSSIFGLTYKSYKSHRNQIF